jgi:hypothetical protein
MTGQIAAGVRRRLGNPIDTVAALPAKFRDVFTKE